MGTEITDDELQAIRARCDAATPGPWTAYETAMSDKAYYRNLIEWQVHSSETEVADIVSECATGSSAKLDADFIAQARTDVPRLLDEIERLRSQLALETAKVKQQQREVMDLRTEIDRVLP